MLQSVPRVCLTQRMRLLKKQRSELNSPNKFRFNSKSHPTSTAECIKQEQIRMTIGSRVSITENRLYLLASALAK